MGRGVYTFRKSPVHVGSEEGDSRSCWPVNIGPYQNVLLQTKNLHAVLQNSLEHGTAYA